MLREDATCALVELRQIGKTPSSTDPVLQHAPEAFKRIEVMPTVGRQEMPPTLLVPVCQRRRELFRPVDATTVGDHDHLLPSVAKEGHHLMDILAQPLRVKMRDNLIDDARGAVLHGADDAEQYAAAHAAPGARAEPRLAFEGFLTFDLTLTQWPQREARALGFAPPAGAGQGKAPHDSFVFIEHNDLAPASPVFQSGEFERGIREVRGLGIEPPGGTAIAYVFFFNTARTLSRLTCTPVWRAKTVASS